MPHSATASVPLPQTRAYPSPKDLPSLQRYLTALQPRPAAYLDGPGPDADVISVIDTFGTHKLLDRVRTASTLAQMVRHYAPTIADELSMIGRDDLHLLHAGAQGRCDITDVDHQIAMSWVLRIYGRSVADVLTAAVVLPWQNPSRTERDQRISAHTTGTIGPRIAALLRSAEVLAGPVDEQNLICAGYLIEGLDRLCAAGGVLVGPAHRAKQALDRLRLGDPAA